MNSTSKLKVILWYSVNNINYYANIKIDFSEIINTLFHSSKIFYMQENKNGVHFTFLDEIFIVVIGT